MPLFLLSSCGDKDDDPNEHYSVDIPTIAHRGYSVKEIDNTEGAFLEAAKRNFIGIETDIRYTKDHRLICNHDEKIQGKVISDMTYGEIEKINLSSDSNKPVRVCPFETYLTICKENKRTPYIEFKFDASKEECLDVIQYTKKYYGEGKLTYISFFRNTCLKLKSIKTEYAYTYDLFRLTKDKKSFYESLDDGIDISHLYTKLDGEMVKDAKKKGVRVAVWTVNNLKACEKMISLGVVSITTDFIECDPKYLA